MFKSGSYSLAIIVGTLLAGCGFQLQGAFSTPAGMERTYVAAPDSFSLFYRELSRELDQSGVTLVDSAADATAVFTIYFDETDQRVLSVSARNVPTEYEVFYTIRYGLVSGEETLIATQDLTLTREYLYDETLVLGKAREQELMREAIVDDLVRIVMTQISAR